MNQGSMDLIVQQSNVFEEIAHKDSGRVNWPTRAVHKVAGPYPTLPWVSGQEICKPEHLADIHSSSKCSITSVMRAFHQGDLQGQHVAFKTKATTHHWRSANKSLSSYNGQVAWNGCRPRKKPPTNQNRAIRFRTSKVRHDRSEQGLF